MGDAGGKLWFVFNELSSRSRAESPFEGGRRFGGMLRAIANAMNGHSAELISLGDRLWGCELAAGYTVTDWIADAESDLRQLLLSIATKTEFPTDAGEALRQRFHLSEFHLADPPSKRSQEAPGLGAAYLLGGVGASLPSEPCWTETRLALRHLWLDHDGRNRRDTVEDLNLAKPIHVAEISAAVLQRRQYALASEPSALAARKGECFPHLRFGRAVDGQILKLPSTHLAACREWRLDEVMLSPQLTDCRRESQPTMQQFGDRRVFPDHDGCDRKLELHVPVGQQYRIHLRVDSQAKVIEIGYVGKHLPTVRHHR